VTFTGVTPGAQFLGGPCVCYCEWPNSAW